MQTQRPHPYTPPARRARSAKRSEPQKSGSAGSSSSTLLEHNLHEERAGSGDAFGEAVVERLHRRDACAGHAHRPREADPVEVRMADIEDVERLSARIAGPNIGEVALKDCIATVREQQ